MMAAYDGKADEALMTLVQKGDHSAFSVLVHRHTQKFFNLAYRTLGNESDAEDVVQTCFTKLWQRPAIWKSGKGAKFTTWFYRIVYNAAIDIRRRQRQSGELHENIPDKETDADDVLIQKEKTGLLEKAIQSLPERQQAALNLFYYEQLPQKEAAEIMGVNIKAFESLLTRAKKALHRFYVQNTEEKEGMLHVSAG